MADETKRDFHGTIWGQAIAGLVVVALGPAVLFLLGQLAEAKVPLWLYVAGIVLVALIMTVIYKPWRKAVWANVAEWRPFTTRTTLDRVRNEGRAELQEELDAQRRRPIKRAQWLISRTEQQYEYAIMNVAEGSTAKDVSLDIDGQLFKPGSGMDWDSIDGLQKKTFQGLPTESGKLYGFPLTVWWTDANEERQHFSVPMKGYSF